MLLPLPENKSGTSTDSRKIRRSKVMIARENKQILDYFLKGATHEQIMKWIGLKEKELLETDNWLLERGIWN